MLLSVYLNDGCNTEVRVRKRLLYWRLGLAQHEAYCYKVRAAVEGSFICLHEIFVPREDLHYFKSWSKGAMWSVKVKTTFGPGLGLNLQPSGQMADAWHSGGLLSQTSKSSDIIFPTPGQINLEDNLNLEHALDLGAICKHLKKFIVYTFWKDHEVTRRPSQTMLHLNRMGSSISLIHISKYIYFRNMLPEHFK